MAKKKRKLRIGTGGPVKHIVVDGKPVESGIKPPVTRIKLVNAKKDFYASKQWLILRYRVLRAYGAKCHCCGRTPADGVKMHVDHIKPRSVYPHLALAFDNLQILCEDCNMGKLNWDTTDWRQPEPDDSEHIAFLKEHGLY